MQCRVFEPEPFRRHRHRDRSVACGQPRPDVARREIPDSVVGRSLLPWMPGETRPWRDVLHDEQAGQHREADGNHWIVNERHKYIWFSQTGEEHLFDVVDDPNEEHELGPETDFAPWRQRLAQELADRPESFSRNGSPVVR